MAKQSQKGGGVSGEENAPTRTRAHGNFGSRK